MRGCDLAELLREMILPFETRAAPRYADLAVNALQERAFAQPTAIRSRSRPHMNSRVASRNTSALEAAGLSVIDP